MGGIDLRAFREQLSQMGSMREMLRKLPRNPSLERQLEGLDVDGQLNLVRGMIDSMTPSERADPHCLDESRRIRIAAGSGVDPSDVASLVRQFDGMVEMFSNLRVPRKRGYF